MKVKTIDIKDLDLSQATRDYLLIHPMEIITYNPSDYSDMLLLSTLSIYDNEDLGDVDDTPVIEPQEVSFSFSGKRK